MTPPTSPIKSNYTCERTRNRSSILQFYLYPFNSRPNESLPLSFIMTSFCLIRMIITDAGTISYSRSSRSAFINVPAYGQIGRNSIINFLHSLSRFQTTSSLEHTVDCARLIPAWERTCVLYTEAKETSKIITKLISHNTLYE